MGSVTLENFLAFNNSNVFYLCILFNIASASWVLGKGTDVMAPVNHKKIFHER